MKLFFVTLLAFLASAHADLNAGKALVESNASCASLSEVQFEAVGEYLMEQMHPGEAHELMHKTMGLREGSEVEKQFHVALAKRLYCNEGTAAPMIGYGSMMNGGIGMPYGMMDWSSGWSLGVNSLLWTLLLLGLVVALSLWIIKLWREVFKKK